MLLRPGNLPFPLEVAHTFGRAGPLVLEIGHGDGRFTAALAHKYPDWNLLGVEISAGSVLRALRRMNRDGIAQVRLFHGEALFALRNFVPPAGLHRVYVNFPDPWPKSRHEENRLLQRSFFEKLSTRLEPGGQLLLTTDHLGYFEFSQSEALASGLFDPAVLPPPDFHLQTKYALKWKAEGRNFYHVVFTQKGVNPQPWNPSPRFEMPHALLTGTLPQPQSFTKQVVPFVGGHAVFLEAFRPLEGIGLIFMVHLSEENLVQQILIEARPAEYGVYVGLMGFGAPLASPGVKAAVAWLVTWLEAQGLGVRQRSY